MKARKVKRLDPDARLDEGLARTIDVRLQEVLDLGLAALDPDDVESLHDLRIACKRLRYLLELSSGLYGPYAAEAAKEAKDLQDLLGEVHDCDEMLPGVLDHAARLREEDAAWVVARGDEKAAARAPHRADHRGLAVLAVHLRARRDLLYRAFLDRWAQLQERDFAGALREALASR